MKFFRIYYKEVKIGTIKAHDIDIDDGFLYDNVIIKLLGNDGDSVALFTSNSKPNVVKTKSKYNKETFNVYID